MKTNSRRVSKRERGTGAVRIHPSKLRGMDQEPAYLGGTLFPVRIVDVVIATPFLHKLKTS